MENTMTNSTQITRVRFANPQAADRSLVDSLHGVGVRGGFNAPMYTSAVQDVAYLRARRPPV